MENKKTKDSLDFKSKGEALFLKLKKDILEGTLKPGNALKQLEISSKYNISRIPVRDSIIRLKALGLVEDLNGKSVVTTIDIKKFIEVYEIRIILEDYVMKKSIPIITKKNVEEIINKMKEIESIGNSDLVKRMELDREFHFKIYESCKIQTLIEILKNLYNSTSYSRLKHAEKPGKIEIAETEHRELCRAIQKKDVKKARSLIKKHIKNSIESIKEYKNNKVFK